MRGEGGLEIDIYKKSERNGQCVKKKEQGCGRRRTKNRKERVREEERKDGREREKYRERMETDTCIGDGDEENKFGDRDGKREEDIRGEKMEISKPGGAATPSLPIYLSALEPNKI